MPSGWSVKSGRILAPAGVEFMTAGLNGGVAIGTGASFSIASNVSVGWAYDGYPGVSFKRYSDVWATAPQLVSGSEAFPGGTISPGKYWNHAILDDGTVPAPSGIAPAENSGTIVTLPDRVYALTGVRSSDAIAFGIPQPTDHWHAEIFRINCHLVNGPNTWGSAPTFTAADTVPQYVARAQELVARGLVVSIEDHDMTGLDIELPAALVANPSLALSSIPAGPHQDACRLYDAVAAAFPGASHNVWIGLPNEAWTTGRNTNLTNNATLTQRYDDFVVTYVRRIRAAGFTGIITIPTGRWAGELGPLSRGDYDSLITTLASHGAADNLVWEWHQYGSDYPVGVGASAVTYTYAAADEQLAACRAKGIAVWMSEYGRPTPTPLPADTITYRTVAAVDIMAKSVYGTPLAQKYPWICPTWWSTADNTFNVSYALTYGAANKGNDAGPDPNTTGPNAGVFPWWKITSTAARDEWLTYGGRAHWDIAHTVATLAARVPMLRLGGTGTLASAVTSTATSLPLTGNGWPAIDQYPLDVLVGGERITVAGVTGATTQTLTPVTRSVNGVVKAHSSGATVSVADQIRLTLGTSTQSAGAAAVAPPPSSAGSFRSQLSLATTGQPPHVLTKLGYTGTTKITRAQLDGILDAWCTSHGGTIRTVTSSGTWTSALAAAVPGDLIRVTSSFTADIAARGSKYSLGGANLTASTAGGTESLPIILTCANGVSVTGSSTSSNTATLDIQNCSHVWAVGFNTIGGQFGIRAMNWGGTAAAPAYRAYCSATGTGHSAIIAQGWFQLITTSGGTPPDGTGNEWGFSEWFVDEENYAANVGLLADQFGETYYYGRGSAPGWVSYCKDFWHRGNEGYQFRADGIDLKPGCHRYRVLDNRYHGGYCVFGSPMTINYVSADLDAKPAWMPADIEGYLEGNRVWDINLSLTSGSSANIGAYCGLSGQRWANNLFWGIPQTGFTGGIYIRNEKGTDDTTAVATFGTAPTWFVNNLFWGTAGAVVKGGYGSGAGFPDPYPASVVFIERNNIADNLTGAQAQADSIDFIATVPAVGAVGDATNGTAGPGSAFQLKGTSALNDTGVSIADLDLYIEADLFQQPIPGTGVNPGPFQ